MDPDMTPSERIAEARKRAGLTQAELAEELAVDANLVYMWEAGKRKPGGPNRERLSEVLGVSQAYLIGESEDLPPASPPALKRSGSTDDLLLQIIAQNAAILAQNQVIIDKLVTQSDKLFAQSERMERRMTSLEGQVAASEVAAFREGATTTSSSSRKRRAWPAGAVGLKGGLVGRGPRPLWTSSGRSPAEGIVLRMVSEVEPERNILANE